MLEIYHLCRPNFHDNFDRIGTGASFGLVILKVVYKAGCFPDKGVLRFNFFLRRSMPGRKIQFFYSPYIIKYIIGPGIDKIRP